MFEIKSLTRELASSLIGELVEMRSDLSDDRWTDSHFTAEVPGKWQLSLVAFSGGEALAGYAIASMADPRRAHLHRIVVAPEHRGKGLGKQLLDRLQSEARAQGLSRLSLKAAADNDSAIKFYEREGMEFDGDGTFYKWMSTRLGAERIVACHQPNFLPWAGYMTKLVQCDDFVILDDVQMPTGRSYVSRTRIADSDEARWLSVPVSRSSDSLIVDVLLADDPKWRGRHLRTLQQVFAKAPFVNDLMDIVSVPYEAEHTHLAPFNIELLSRVAEYFGVRRKTHLSSTLGITSTSDQRLLDIVLRLKGSVYLSGKGGQNYQEPKKFRDANVELRVREYKPPTYDRGPHPFIGGLSILDLIAWRGREAVECLRYPD